MVDSIRLMTGRRYRMPDGDTVTALPGPASRAAPLTGCVWMLFGAAANYAVVADGSIRMTMAAAEAGVIRLAPTRGWPTSLRIGDLRPAT